jgi:quinoprotein glucose dehydrogenase
VPDFYGGKRKGDNLFSNSILALDAETGKYIWHFQGVHHDLWDYDFPTSPVLVSIKKDGKNVDGLVQVSKQGFIYMLDRETGKPIYPIIERPVPSSDLAGEKASATQPFPTVLPPFVRQEFNESDLNNVIPDSSYQDLKKRFLSHKSGKMFIPPSVEGTVVLPGLTGGAEWGGPSFDPSSGLLYINATEMPWVVTMIDTLLQKEIKSTQTNLQAGKSIYEKNCKGCHGADLKGSGNFPSLVNIQKKFTEVKFKEIVSSGQRMMPAFKYFSDEDKTALASYLLNIESKQKLIYTKVARLRNPFYQSPYRFGGYKQFLTKEGYPGIKPPWGTLSAIDLSTGRLVWKNTLGDYPELKAKGIHAGTENWGGSVVTAGGLVFIAATRDEKFRAFNKTTGKLLFETSLPAGGYASPSVYSVNGKQFVVIACGGGKMGTKSADTYVAFSLPDK